MRKLNSRIFKYTEEDLAALVDSEEALSGNIDNLRSECLSMFNQSFLNNFQHFIRTTANISKIVENLSQLIKSEVSVKTFIDKFLFDQLPEFIILQGH